MRHSRVPKINPSNKPVANLSVQTDPQGRVILRRGAAGRPTALLRDHRPHMAAAFDRAARPENIPPQPAWPRRRGIVICAGGWRFFPSLFVTLSVLRKLGCRLPVQVWYLGDRGEFDPRMAHHVRHLGPVQFIDGDRFQRDNPQWRFADVDERNPGWALKALAAAASPFAEVLSLDADCYPVGNARMIFECAGFKRTGAVFFPDLSNHVSKICPAAWRAFGLPPREELEWETGQFAIDKRRQWPATWLSFWLNSHSAKTYQWIYGDKDTFHFAWRKLAAPVAIHPEKPWHRRVAFLQRLPDGRLFSIHRCNDKFRLDAGNREGFMSHQVGQATRYVAGLPREASAHAAFMRCKRAITTPSLWIIGHPKGGTTLAWQIASRLTGLCPHPAGRGELLNPDNGPPMTRQFDGSDAAYHAAAQALFDWRTGGSIKTVTQPAIVARFVREHPAAFRVLFIDRDPAAARARQLVAGWRSTPEPAVNLPLLKAAVRHAEHSATVRFDDLIAGHNAGDHAALRAALESLGYSIAQ